MKFKRKYEEYIGKVIRNVEIISIIRYDEKNKLPEFKYKCSCGLVSIRTCSQFLNKKDENRVIYCDCNRSRSNVKIRDYKMTTYNAVYGTYKRGAKKRNLVFELSKKDFIQIVNKKCSYCGDSQYRNIYLVLNDTFSKNKKGTINRRGSVYSEIDLQKYTVHCVGIDRKDGNKGYTIDNILPCCSRCNLMKNTLNLKDFYNHIDKIYNFKKENIHE